jgi:predicted transposase YdaD
VPDAEELRLKNLKDLDMLITDLPELEDTDFYRLVLEKGEAKGKAEGKAEGAASALLRLGRRFWGPALEDIPALLSALETAQLEDLIELVPDLANWDALRSKIPAKPASE